MDEQPGLTVSVAEDGGSATMTASGAGWSATFTLDELTRAIEALGMARQAMLRGQPRPPLAGQGVRAVLATQWYVGPELTLGGSVLGFEHPWYGPLGFVVLPEHGVEMARLLSAQCRMGSLGSLASN